MAKQPQPCGCGCGGMTKGGRFLPGHDARFHAAQKEGRLAGAIAHATGAHGTASVTRNASAGIRGRVDTEKPGDAAPVGEGVQSSEKGTTVRPGMWVRHTSQTMKGMVSKEGIVFSVDQFGNIGFLDEAGGQHMGRTGQTWVVDTNVKRRPNPAQRRVLVNIGREVPGM